MQTLRDVVHASPDAIIGTDETSHVISWNAAAADIFGYTAEEMIGQPIDKIVPPDQVASRIAISNAIDAGQVIRDVEMRVSRADGQIADLSITVAPMIDANGLIVGSSSIVRDNTEHRQVLEALRDAEQRYRTMIDHSPAVTYTEDARTGIVYASPQVFELSGYTQEEISSRKNFWFDTVHPDDLERVAAVAAEADESLEPYAVDMRVFRKDGRMIWLHNRGVLHRDHDGNEKYWQGFLLDITDQKLADARLRETERMLRSLVEQSPGVLYRTPPDTLERVTYLSPQFETMTGWSVQEVIAANEDWLKNGIHPDDQELVRSAYRCAAASAQPFHIEYRMRTRTGDDLWVHDEAHLVCDEAGMPLFWHGLIIDIGTRKSLENELRHQAFHDALTGLPNRLLLVERAERAIAQSQRGGAAAAVLFLDLDNFKVVNDSLGHGHGDAVLCEVARRLMTVIREADTISRFGGDEFAILLTDIIDPETAIATAERVRAAVEPPIDHLQRQINLTTSIGIAVLDGSIVEPDDLIRRADVAMYRAKVAGKNRIAVFDADLHQVALHRLETETDLRAAVANHQFELHYQPKVSLATGVITGFEALVRWNHPSRGQVSPMEFIPMAEESGLIGPLGNWILDTACRQAVAWPRVSEHAEPLTVSVNLSPRQFQQADLVQQVETTLNASGLPPECLVIEITETAVMEDIDVTIARLRALKELGVKIAIDDFGTGYSSLAYLKRFPVDVLKIDRSFVTGLGITPVDTAIVSATITLAHTLGIIVVAEGVETPEQRDRLIALSCDRAQGYLFSAPIRAGSTLDLIRHGVEPEHF